MMMMIRTKVETNLSAKLNSFSVVAGDVVLFKSLVGVVEFSVAIRSV